MGSSLACELGPVSGSIGIAATLVVMRQGTRMGETFVCEFLKYLGKNISLPRYVVSFLAAFVEAYMTTFSL